mmetsp:Transcript_31402/g.91102  ORF Transcript_31402/g.91102 Transcript_31402/m.91102 type:complete len:217 (-) Transcript_31402:294-944(-)
MGMSLQHAMGCVSPSGESRVPPASILMYAPAAHSFLELLENCQLACTGRPTGRSPRLLLRASAVVILSVAVVVASLVATLARSLSVTICMLVSPSLATSAVTWSSTNRRALVAVSVPYNSKNDLKSLTVSLSAAISLVSPLTRPPSCRPSSDDAAPASSRCPVLLMLLSLSLTTNMKGVGVLVLACCAAMRPWSVRADWKSAGELMVMAGPPTWST